MHAPIAPAPRIKRPLFRSLALGGAAALAVGFSAVTGIAAAAADEPNIAPVANDDFYTVMQDTELSISNLCANDVDENGDDLDAVSIGNLSTGTFININGSFCEVSWMPPAGFVGEATFTYLAHDHTAPSAATATVTITVEAAPATNHAPIANPDSFTTGVGQGLYVDAASGLLANDTDPDGDPIQLVSAGNVGAAIPGFLWTVNEFGALTATPPAGFTGTATMEYLLSDGDLTAWGTFEIVVADEQIDYATPIAVADHYTATAGEPLVAAVSLLANDSDADSSFMVKTYLLPAHGDITAFDAAGGFFTYVPDPGFIGTDSFSYRLTDPNGGLSEFVTVTIDVAAGEDTGEETGEVPGDEPTTENSGDSDLDTLGGVSEDSTGTTALAYTGGTSPVGYALAALVLVAAGGVSILGERRRSTERG